MVMPLLRLRQERPPSVVSSTPAVEMAISTRSGLRGSTTMEWMPGANSPPSEAGVPNHFVSPVPSPLNRSPPRDSWFHKGRLSSNDAPPSRLSNRPPGIVPIQMRPPPNAMTQSFSSVALRVVVFQPTPNSLAESSNMSWPM